MLNTLSSAFKRALSMEKIRSILFLSGSIVLARTAFFAITNNIETRYSVEAAPETEFLTIFKIVYFIKIYREKT